jgi:hypothetical protein
MTHTRPWPLPSGKGTTVHHVSDLHVGYRPWAYQETDHMRQDVLDGLIPPVDAFVITGDIVDDATAAEMAYAKTWMNDVAKNAGSMWVPGNHDLRYPTTTLANWEASYGRKGNTVLDLPGYRFIGFTAEVNNWKKAGDPDTHWNIPAATWDWMDQQIAGTTNPVILCCHYPPWELEPDDDWCIQNKVTLAQFITDHPSIVGMLVGHMHWEITNPKTDSFIQIGNRTSFPVIMGVSAMLSISGLAQDMSARIPSISKYVTFYEDRWEVRYRLHGPHAWGGPNGLRLATMDLSLGSIERSM